MTNLIPVGMGESDGLSRIGKVGDLMKMPPFIGMGGTPTLTLTSLAGTGATASISGTNVSGVITLNSGILGIGIGKILTLNFADGFAYPNGAACVFSPANANFANVYGKLFATGLTTGVELNVSLALAISSTYVGTYTVSGW